MNKVFAITGFIAKDTEQLKEKYVRYQEVKRHQAPWHLSGHLGVATEGLVFVEKNCIRTLDDAKQYIRTLHKVGGIPLAVKLSNHKDTWVIGAWLQTSSTIAHKPVENFKR